jgi:fusaric acid resistance family protein
VPQTQAVRRDLTRRVIALDPIIDQALGEASQLRYHSPILQRARHGLFTAISGWRCVARRLEQLPPGTARHEAELALRSLPPELQSDLAPGALARGWANDPLVHQNACERSAGVLLALPAGTPSLRLVADQTAEFLTGTSHVLAGLALLVDAPGRPQQSDRGFRLSVPDFLPAFVAAARAFFAIAAVEILWIVTAWPSGGVAVLFTAVLVLLFSPRGDAAYASAIAFTVGTLVCISLTAIIKFAVLPGVETFAALSAVLGIYLIPVGFGLAYSRRPVAVGMLTAIGIGFVPLLEPANEMTYDTVQFYNSAVAIFAGSVSAALAFALLPPPSPALRTRRLIAFALRDLRQCAMAPLPPEPDDWEGRMYGRLESLPEQTEPLQLGQLLAALAVGSEVLRLRRMASALALGPELGAALHALAQGDSSTARIWLARLDHRLAAPAGAETQTSLALRARASILAVSEALARHAEYFDWGAPA